MDFLETHSARKESLGVGLGLPNGSIAEVY